MYSQPLTSTLLRKPARGKKIKQINNLTIYYNAVYGYRVFTPDNRCWEEFDTLQDAESFCIETKDFIKK